MRRTPAFQRHGAGDNGERLSVLADRGSERAFQVLGAPHRTVTDIMSLLAAPQGAGRKTAQALGLTFTNEIMLQVTEVIE